MALAKLDVTFVLWDQAWLVLVLFLSATAAALAARWYFQASQITQLCTLHAWAALGCPCKHVARGDAPREAWSVIIVLVPCKINVPQVRGRIPCPWSCRIWRKVSEMLQPCTELHLSLFPQP